MSREHRQFSYFLLALITFCITWSVLAGAERLRQVFHDRYGYSATQSRFDPWQQFMISSQSLPESEKLRRTNDYLNRAIRYAEDAAIWDVSDYWATPIESIGRGLGDCEDYVIAKYFTLKLLGIPDQKLCFFYVKATLTGPSGTITGAHMVLAYFSSPDAMPLILDNLVGELKSANDRPDLVPVFSFNMGGVFTSSGSKPSSPVEKLSRWNDLIQRMRFEGFDL